MISPKEKLVGLKPEFQDVLIRIAARLPFTLLITSGLRTADGNSVLKGAVPDSAHLSGLAVDVAVGCSREAAQVIDACKAEGITRRGVYVNKAFQPVHIHLDMDNTKPEEVLFIKQEQN